MSIGTKRVEDGSPAKRPSLALANGMRNACQCPRNENRYIKATRSIARQGIQAFVSQLLEPQRAVERVTAATVDDMIAELDRSSRLC